MLKYFIFIVNLSECNMVADLFRNTFHDLLRIKVGIVDQMMDGRRGSVSQFK